MLRGALVALIYKKIFRLQSDVTASAAVTHMSTDIDSIAIALEGMHDTWASMVEIGVGAFILSRYVGGATFLVAIPALSNIPLLDDTACIRHLQSLGSHYLDSYHGCFDDPRHQVSPSESSLEPKGPRASGHNLRYTGPTERNKNDGSWPLVL